MVKGMKNIGARPTNPAEISFAAHCFRQVGTRTEYSVRQSALHSGPAQFGTNKAAAEAFARKVGKPVAATEVAVMERISWR